MLIGSHVSYKSSEQLLGSVKEAIGYNSSTFMFYTGAPQNTKRSDINYDLTKEAITLMDKNNIKLEDIVIHAPYIINLADNENEEKYQFAIDFLKKEIKRVEMFGVEKLVLHPGSFVNLDIDTGINNVINALNEVIEPKSSVKICLETMAGKGTEVCFKLEHIKKIIDNVKYSDNVMVCLDTCHLNDAGYDMSKFDLFLDEFDELIGIDKIGCIHINDSKNEIGARKDRHENIGYGYIGFDSLINIIYNKRLENIPKILETPYVSMDGGKDRTYPPYKFEIEMIKSKTFNKNLYDDVRSYYKN
ncbi:MAG: deoxyribonuclease IV [Bacilli bacterium]|nr:deoxyribonuclease IV [Bacilli bacterium]